MTRACRPLTAWRRLAVPLCAAALLAPGPAAAVDTCSGLALGTPSAQTTGATPVALVGADFDLDGKIDVVTANAGVGDVSLLRGDGLGGLAVPTSATAVTSPVDLVAGDLDRDGFLDLVVASSGGPFLALLKGAGTSFGIPTAFDAGVTPRRLGLGDFNRDGYPDLVVVSAGGVVVFAGNGTLGFDAQIAAVAVTDAVAAVAGDFNRDGHLDLAVASAAADQVAVFLGTVTGFLGNGAASPTPFATVTPGAGTHPLDLAAGDVDRDGKLDLVTADQGTGTATVLLGAGDGSFAAQTPVAVGGLPGRVKLLDLDRDGTADLVVLDETPATPGLVAFEGDATFSTHFDPTPHTAPLQPSSMARGLAAGDFTSDGRADLVTSLSDRSQAVVVQNQSGFTCTRSSFGAAPRSYSVADGPVSTAAADFDEDGRVDLAVATINDRWIRIRLGAGGDFVGGALDLGPFPAPPRALATADLDVDGHVDLVVAFGDPYDVNPGSAGRVQVFLGNGIGGFTPGVSLPAGTNTSALAIGDFDGNGAPDVAAASEGDGKVWVFLGNGAGGLTPVAGNPVLSALNRPRALVAADLTGDGLADLAIAESGLGAVHVLRSNGGAPLSFTLITPSGVGLPVGSSPEGIAAAALDGDGWLDLVTADGGAGVSVIRRTGVGGFLPAVPYAAGVSPSAVALVDLDGDSKPDIAVTSLLGTLTLLVNDGTGLFPTRSDYPVRSYPVAVTPLDADADGSLDLAVACQSADAVVVLLSRPPGPPPLATAPRTGVGSRPHAVAAVDLDGDGDLDLAVANKDSNTVSLLRNDGAGGFTLYRTLAVGEGPESIVAGDFNRDGSVDLAVNAPLAPTKGVSILLGSTVTAGEFDPSIPVPVGMAPDDLAAGDFDRDGDLDIAVCDKVSTPGYVRILKNDGLGLFSLGSSASVGNLPTSIAAADFDRDGDLDLAVGLENQSNVQILTNNGLGFTVTQTLALPGTDRNPLSLAAEDFDGDGAADLAASASIGERVYVYRNLGAGTFATTPGASLDAPNSPEFVAAADLNLDGRADLLAVATGLSVFRGKGAMGFELPETVVAGWTPWAAAVGDFNRDGWPDLAVVNDTSNDLSLLLSTSCRARRLEVSVHPAACEMGPLPYGPDAEVWAYDEGSNPAACAAGTVVPSIVLGTGDPDATLGGAGVSGLPLANGIASFTGLTLNRPGRRYRLQFSLAGVPPVQTRSFTLGPELQILGVPSLCQGGSSTFRTEGSYDTYAWTLDSLTPPFAFTPTVVLSRPPLALGPHTLAVETRVDGCAPLPVSRSIYVGNLVETTLSADAAPIVCMDCIGPTIKPTDVGGGPAQSRQWGYRAISGTPPIVPMPGETGETYVLKGSSFPGPGTYHVVVSTVPTCGTAAVSQEIAVTVITSAPNGEVQFLGASARGSAGLGGQVKLQWVNSTGTADEVRVRWNKAPDDTSLCVPPDDTMSAATGEAVVPSPTGTWGTFPHTGLAFDTAYCYSVFVKRTDTWGNPVWSPGRTVKARPFNAETGPVKWAYSTGATAVVPPVVGTYAVLAMSNDHTVHAVKRGSSGGLWPPDWVPQPLMGVAHSRSPIVPLPPPVFPSSDSVLFVGDDGGWVQAVDAKVGSILWGPVRPDATATITGAPGAILTQYGGARDLILVPTRDNDSLTPSALYGLRLTDGATLGSFDGGGTMGPINGSPAVDYATQRVYVASRSFSGGPTIWCIQVQAEPAPAFAACSDWTPPAIGDVDVSPVIRGGRVYVGDTAGTVYSLDAATGGDVRTFVTGDGAVKGFLFPDRRNDNLFFATDTKVWSISDNGAASMPKNWEVGGLNPSIVLYRPQSNYVYVGGRNGTLYELELNAGDETAIPTVRSRVLGDGTGQIGAPTLDISPPDVVTPGNKLLVVGSEAGVLYGVEVPLPPS
jgi:hypothetical protein